MSGILKKIDLKRLVESFYIEDITPDIVWKLTIDDFEKLGLKDRSLIMRLRIECSKFGSFSSQKKDTRQVNQLPKQLLEDLIDKGSI